MICTEIEVEGVSDYHGAKKIGISRDLIIHPGENDCRRLGRTWNHTE